MNPSPSTAVGTTMSRQQARRTSWLEKLAHRGDIAVILLLISIISLFVLPIPTALLDLLIGLNIAASIGLLMLSIYVPSAVGLSTFPSLLLLTTLLRLSLNIASTKQILLNAHAGHIIETFGRLVVGGNVLVGGVVFVIIAVVQFIVIAKGSERVAEVGARFTLDGMPGKQMSIDADLRGGLINKDEARERRAALEQESQWHGAMDGAMKFVKGDAIAGLVIAFVNIIGGIGVGAGQKGMSLADAVQRYTLLTVGDGMVTQIPSLFVSVAAGILITRVTSAQDRRANLGRQLMGQVLAQPMSMVMTAVVLLLFLLVPGFPKIQFGLLGAVVGVVAWAALKRDRALNDPEHQPMPALRGDAERLVPQMIQSQSDRDAAPVLVKLSPSLQGKLWPKAFADAVQQQRTQLYESIGLPFPGIRLRYDAELAPGQYSIHLRDIHVAQGQLVAGAHWAQIEGDVPADLQPASAPGLGDGVWVPVARLDALPRISAVRAPEAVLAAHVGQCIAVRADLFIGIQEVQRILDEVSRNQPELAQELIRAVPLQRVAEVMKRLVREGISLRNTREIFESLMVWATREKDVSLLTEYVRIDLGAVTAARLGAGRSELPIVILTQGSENLTRESIQETLGGSFLALGPEKNEAITQQAQALVEKARQDGHDPVFACSMDLRRHLASQLEAVLPGVPVVSYQELGNHIRVSLVGSIDLTDTPALAHG
jgi:type III secretion protein V